MKLFAKKQSTPGSQLTQKGCAARVRLWSHGNHHLLHFAQVKPKLGGCLVKSARICKEVKRTHQLCIQHSERWCCSPAPKSPTSKGECSHLSTAQFISRVPQTHQRAHKVFQAHLEYLCSSRWAGALAESALAELTQMAV